MNERGILGRRLLLAGLVLVALNLAGALLPRDPELDLLFGVESFSRLGLPALGVSSLVLLMLLASPRAAEAVADGLAALLARIPRPIRTPLLLVGLVSAFLLLTDQRLSGDAKASVWLTAAGITYPSNALTCYLQQLVDALPGIDAQQAVRLVSVASGPVYALAALGIAREVFPAGPRRVALVVLLLASGSSALFFGILEVYAPFVAGLAVYLLLGLRYRRGRAPWFLPPFALGVTFALHGSAGLLLPSLLLLANGDRLWPWRMRRWLAWGGVFLVPVVLVFAALYFLSWGGEPPAAEQGRTGTFFGAMGQGPLLPLFRAPGNLLHRYALFDLEHLVGVVNLLLLAAPASSLLLLFGRWRKQGADFAWVGSVAAFLVAFPLFWNVGFPLRQDWDLFSPMGVPLALLAGLAFLGPKTDRLTALRVAAIALFGLVPFVLDNTGGRTDALRYARSMASAFHMAEKVTSGARREECVRAKERWQARASELDRVSTLLDGAARFEREGDLVAAEETYRRVVAIAPENGPALTRLGILLWKQGRRAEGRDLMRRAIRAAPDTYAPRSALAWSYAQEGRVDETIRELQRAVRYGGIEASAVAGLRQLGRIHRARGEEALARLMFEMADEREPPSRPVTPRNP